MGIVRGFLPFILFAILARQIGIQPTLWISGGMALLQLLRGVSQGESIKFLDACGGVLFLGLALFATFVDPRVSWFAVHMTVNGGLALIALGSMVIRRPFTLQYAREQTPPEVWSHPVFIRTNYRITGVWSAAFVIQAVAYAAPIVAPGVPGALAIAVSVAAFAGGLLFTIEYPKRVRARFAAASPRV